MELEDDASLLAHEWLKLVTDEVFVELGHVKLLVPLMVQSFLSDHLCQFDVGESSHIVVFRQLRFK